MRKIYIGLLIILVPLYSFAGMVVRALPYYYDNTCPKDTPISQEGGGKWKCFGCDAPVPIKENIAFIDECPNRVRNGYGYSILKECPKEFPLREWGGNCISCEGLNEEYVNHAEDCDACPNRHYDSDRKRCVLNECPANHPLFDMGDCMSCDAPYLLTEVSKEQCDLCPNRRYKEKQAIDNISFSELENSGLEKEVILEIVKSTTGCYLLPNNEEKPLPHIPLTDGLGCSDCAKRWVYEQYFYTCDTLNDVETLSEFCEKCPQRYYEGGYCKLKPEHRRELEKYLNVKPLSVIEPLGVERSDSLLIGSDSVE